MKAFGIDRDGKAGKKAPREETPHNPDLSCRQQWADRLLAEGWSERLVRCLYGDDVTIGVVRDK